MLVFIAKKGQIKLIAQIDITNTEFYDIKPLEINIKPNIDISKKWNELIDYTNKVNNFQKEFKELLYIDNVNLIEEELNDYFENDILKCRYWSRKNETHFHFNLYPKDEAPDHGILFKIESGVLFMHDDRCIDNLLYHMRFDNSAAMLSKKIKIINYINDKIVNFDLTNFRLLLDAYNTKIDLQNLINKYNIK